MDHKSTAFGNQCSGGKKLKVAMLLTYLLICNATNLTKINLRFKLHTLTRHFQVT